MTAQDWAAGLSPVAEGQAGYFTRQQAAAGLAVNSWRRPSSRPWRADILWHGVHGFRAHSQRFTVVAQIDIAESDPSDSTIYDHWGQLGEQVILQREWDSRASH